MAIYVKVLKNDVLPSGSAVDLYTVPANKSAIVRNIRFVNTTGVSVTVNLFYFNKAANKTTRLTKPNLSVPANDIIIDDKELSMAAEDKITGSAGAGTSIDYTISGMERDA